MAERESFSSLLSGTLKPWLLLFPLSLSFSLGVVIVRRILIIGRFSVLLTQVWNFDISCVSARGKARKFFLKFYLREHLWGEIV